MKVGTDGVLLGLFASYMQHALFPVPPTLQHARSAKRLRILDIGCGSGVVSLIVAQWLRAHRIEVDVCGVDIDGGAVSAASSNFIAAIQRNGEWSAGTVTFTGCVGDVCADETVRLLSTTPFDIIVSNPPYFDPRGMKRSRDSGLGDGSEQSRLRIAARMRSSLNTDVLARQIPALLAPRGVAHIIYPFPQPFTAFVGDLPSPMAVAAAVRVRDNSRGKIIRYAFSVMHRAELVDCKGDNVVPLRTLSLHLSNRDRRFSDEYKLFAAHVFPYFSHERTRGD